jgi:hypothetical protein
MIEPRDTSSGWEQWIDPHGTLHVKITLTAHDQRKIGPPPWEMLQEAGRMIQAALAEPD